MKVYKKIMIITVLVLAIGGIAAYIIITGKVRYNPEGTVGNTTGNLMNGGVFAEYNGVIYFANPNDKNRLYSMNSDCSNLKKLTDDAVSCINVCENYIFYVRNNLNSDNSGRVLRGHLFGIVRTNLKGKYSKTLTIDTVSQMVLNGNTLIYACYKDNKITTKYVSIDKKTTETALFEELPLYSLRNNRLYYSGTEGDHNIYAFNCSSKVSSVFFEGNTYLASMAEDNCLYYIDLSNNYALTKYNPATGESLVLHSGRCINYNVYEDVVFFQTEGTESALHRISTNGTNDVVVTVGNTASISCTSQYTFFSYFGQNILYRVPTHGLGPVEILTTE